MNQDIPSSDFTDDFDVSEELNRAWDTWNAHSPQHAAGENELSNLFAELDAIDDAPTPDPAFLAALRADLVKPIPVLSTTPMSQSSLGLVAMPTVPTPFPRLTPIRLVYAGIAATLLIAALVGGNRWLPGSGSAVMVASAMASPATQDEPTATTYPDSSTIFNGSRSPSIGRSIGQLVTYPTAIPISPENPADGVINLQVVRTPAIVYSIE